MHWSLVVEKITTATTYAKYKEGEFRSVGTEEAIRRLRKMAGVEVSETADKPLDALGKLRNQIQHYGLEATREETESVAAKTLDFLVDFLDHRLLPEVTLLIRVQAENDMLHVRRGLNRIQGYVDERMDRLAGGLKGLEDRTVQCTRCFKDTLVAGDGTAPATVRCHFCNTTFAPEMIAAEYEAVHFAGLFHRGGQAVCAHCGRNESVARFVVRVTEARAKPADSDVYDHVVFCFACAAPALLPAQGGPA